MPVGLHEGWIGPLVNIAQCRHLHSRLGVWRQLEPSLVHRGGLAQQMSLLEKSADTAIDERRPLRIGGITQCVGPVFLVVRKPRVGRSADIAGGEVGEQRVLTRSAVTVTAVALRLAAE